MSYKTGDCPYYEPSCPSYDIRKANFGTLTCECSKFKAYIKAQNPTEVNQTLKEMNLDITKPKMQIMLEMQKLFANKFHSVENLSKEEIDKWVKEYLICIDDEMSEAREYLKYGDNKTKTWNKTEFNKELIDAFHFIMNTMIVSNMSYEILEETYLKTFHPNILKVNDILQLGIETEKEYVNSLPKEWNNLILINQLLDSCRQIRACISWKHWKKANNEINMNKLYIAIATMFKRLIQLFVLNNLSLDDIYNIYIKKNIENHYRQQFGYNK